MPKRVKLDDLDRQIIAILTEDGRLSASEVAGRLGSATERTVRNRITALLQSRAITIGAMADPIAIGNEESAEFQIVVEPGKLESVARALAEYDEVFYLAAASGEVSLIAAVNGPTQAELLDFSEDVVAAIPGVQRVEIVMILRIYKIFGTRTSASAKAKGGAR